MKLPYKVFITKILTVYAFLILKWLQSDLLKNSKDISFKRHFIMLKKRIKRNVITCRDQYKMLLMSYRLWLMMLLRARSHQTCFLLRRFIIQISLRRQSVQSNQFSSQEAPIRWLLRCLDFIQRFLNLSWKKIRMLEYWKMLQFMARAL